MNNWDLYAPFYNLSRKFELNAYEQMYKNIRKAVKNKCVLELATGTGLIACNVADSAKLIEATDFSDKMIEQAKKNIHINNVNFSIQDACDLPYENNSYDAVIISNALHIMPDPDSALAEIKRVLKSDGVLIAPTYVWGDIKGSQKLSSLVLKMFGFKVENKWKKDDYLSYLCDKGWSVRKAEVIDACYPLCYVECTHEV
ncbi:MAG: class I SAM-dependent methyltransferase [Ruminococcus sp.]|nr:class I SAM-dependent methyltransferase [Ruminococcus sp.]